MQVHLTKRSTRLITTKLSDRELAMVLVLLSQAADLMTNVDTDTDDTRAEILALIERLKGDWAFSHEARQ